MLLVAKGQGRVCSIVEMLKRIMVTVTVVKTTKP